MNHKRIESLISLRISAVMCPKLESLHTSAVRKNCPFKQANLLVFGLPEMQRSWRRGWPRAKCRK